MLKKLYLSQQHETSNIPPEMSFFVNCYFSGKLISLKALTRLFVSLTNPAFNYINKLFNVGPLS